MVPTLLPSFHDFGLPIFGLTGTFSFQNLVLRSSFWHQSYNNRVIDLPNAVSLNKPGIITQCSPNPQAQTCIQRFASRWISTNFFHVQVKIPGDDDFMIGFSNGKGDNCSPCTRAICYVSRSPSSLWRKNDNSDIIHERTLRVLSLQKGVQWTFWRFLWQINEKCAVSGVLGDRKFDKCFPGFRLFLIQTGNLIFVSVCWAYSET